MRKIFSLLYFKFTMRKNKFKLVVHSQNFLENQVFITTTSMFKHYFFFNIS